MECWISVLERSFTTSDLELIQMNLKGDLPSTVVCVVTSTNLIKNTFHILRKLRSLKVCDIKIIRTILEGRLAAVTDLEDVGSTEEILLYGLDVAAPHHVGGGGQIVRAPGPAFDGGVSQPPDSGQDDLLDLAGGEAGEAGQRSVS